MADETDDPSGSERAVESGATADGDVRGATADGDARGATADGDARGTTADGESSQAVADGEPHGESILDRVRRYARTVDVDVDLSTVSWEVSERAKRRAGVCLFDRQTGQVTIRLARGAYEQFDWDEFAAVVRHELVHAWEFQQFGESGHGERFRRKAATLDVSRYCPSFTAARLRLVCTDDDCAWTVDRHRASPSVTRPEARRCGDCGAPYVVEHAPTGERWRTATGYEAARDRIGDDW